MDRKRVHDATLVVAANLGALHDNNILEPVCVFVYVCCVGVCGVWCVSRLVWVSAVFGLFRACQMCACVCVRGWVHSAFLSAARCLHCVVVVRVLCVVCLKMDSLQSQLLWRHGALVTAQWKALSVTGASDSECGGDSNTAVASS